MTSVLPEADIPRGVPMTTTTFHVVGSLADSAVDRERQILWQKRNDEQQTRNRLDKIHAEQERLRGVEAEVSNDLAACGRAVLTQEKRLTEVEAAIAKKAKEVQELMDQLGLQALPPQPQPTIPDDLGVGDVPATEREAFYVQQAAEQGVPSPSMTAPHPIPADPAVFEQCSCGKRIAKTDDQRWLHTDDHTEACRTDLTSNNPVEQRDDKPVARTGGQPSAEKPRRGGSRG